MNMLIGTGWVVRVGLDGQARLWHEPCSEYLPLPDGPEDQRTLVRWCRQVHRCPPMAPLVEDLRA